MGKSILCLYIKTLTTTPGVEMKLVHTVTLQPMLGPFLRPLSCLQNCDIFTCGVRGGGVGQSVKRPTPKPWAHCPIYNLPPDKLCVSLYVYIYIYSRSHSVYTLRVYYIYCSSVWGLDLFKGSVPKCFVAFDLTIAVCCKAPYESNSL